MYSFFDVLVDVLGLTKAALLLDSRLDQSLGPWCICGFDATTNSQLKIPVNEIPYSHESYLLDSPKNLPVSHLFSGKDYSTIDLLFIMPIRAGKEITGLLIVADNPYLTLSQTERDMIFHPIQDLLRQSIQTHFELCNVPSTLEPALVSELQGKTDVRMKLIESRETDVLISFSPSEGFAVLSTEFRSLSSQAACSDLRFRLISNLQRHINRCFSTPEHDYLWLKSEATGSVGDLMDLAARDLSYSMVASDLYTTQLRACLKVVPMDAFFQASFAPSAA